LHKTVSRDVSRSAPASSGAATGIAIEGWRRLRLWWERFRRFSRRAPRRLRLCESLPLGERRFVAVVEFERSRFLVGGTTSSLVLLARLGTGTAQGGKDPRQEEEQNQDQFTDRNEKEKKDNGKDWITTDGDAAREIHGSVQP
jgi:flagellar biogenesis protein FliO